MLALSRSPRCLGRRSIAGIGAALALLVDLGARADAPSPPPPAPPPASSQPAGPAHGGMAEERASNSPRASLARFLELCRAGRYGDAAEYLDRPSGMTMPPAELARRLKAVLDHHVWFDLDRISGSPSGNATDGLPPLVDELARIPGPAGVLEPVRMHRSEEAGSAGRWTFTAATVMRIPDWYQRLDTRWLLDHLPERLLRPGPRDLLWWQWLALPILFLVTLGIGVLLSSLTRMILGRLVARTAATWDDLVLQRIGGPINVAWALVIARALLPLLGLYAPADAFLRRLLHTGLLVVLFWSVLRVVDVMAGVVLTSRWAADHPASRSLVPLGSRALKLILSVVCFIAVVSDLGYPVGSMIAGLGIGGLALALAAQKTVENLFGAFSLGVDQPFREGDFVKIDDLVGTVEEIGLRSTRIRTLDRTIVSMPNGKLADMRLETFAARDRIRLSTTLGVVYETTAAQMRTILTGIERVLREHPAIWPDSVNVFFANFGASSLDISIMVWFQTSDWNEFQRIRQEVFLAFMDVVEKAGSAFAFPTQTVHLAGDRPPASTASRSSAEGHREAKAAAGT